jgi:hypothetical protein
MTEEEIIRENAALEDISRKASDQTVEVFPSAFAMRASQQQINGNGNAGAQVDQAMRGNEMQQDILMSLIPGSKGRRSIRIHPPSRPTSKSGQSVHSKAFLGDGMNGGNAGRKGDSSVLASLDVNLP